MSKKSNTVIVNPRVGLSPSLPNPTVTIVVPADIQRLLREISLKLQDVQIVYNTRVVSTIRGVITPEQLQLIARNERVNTNGVVKYDQFPGIKDKALIHQLKYLVKQCVVAGVTSATAFGGFHSKRVPTEKRPFIVVDLAGLQFQQRANSGSIVLIQAKPDAAAAGGEAVYRAIMGEAKPSPEECSQDKSGRFVQVVEGEFFDRHAYRQIIARDFLVATQASQIAQAKSAQQEKPSVFRFSRYGCGFFAEDLNYATNTDKNGPRYRFMPIVNVEIFEGVYLGLQNFFANPPEGHTIQRFEFPYYLDARNFNDQDPADYEKAKILASLIEDLCEHNGIEVGFENKDIMAPDEKGKLVCATNTGDPHATAGNEMRYQSVDAEIGEDIADKGSDFSVLTNHAITAQFVEVPHFGYQRKCALIGELSEYAEKKQIEEKYDNQAAAELLMTFLESGCQDSATFLEGLETGKRKPYLHRGNLWQLVKQHIRTEMPELFHRGWLPEAIVSEWLKREAIIREYTDGTSMATAVAESPTAASIITELDSCAKKAGTTEAAALASAALASYIQVQIELTEQEETPETDDKRVISIKLLLGSLGNDGWGHLKDDAIIKPVFSYVRTQVPFSDDREDSTFMGWTIDHWKLALEATLVKHTSPEKEWQVEQKEQAVTEQLKLIEQQRQELLAEAAKLAAQAHNTADVEVTSKIEEHKLAMNDIKQQMIAAARQRIADLAAAREDLSTDTDGDLTSDEDEAHLEEKVSEPVAYPTPVTAEGLTAQITAYIAAEEAKQLERYDITAREDMSLIAQTRMAIAEAMQADLTGDSETLAGLLLDERFKLIFNNDDGLQTLFRILSELKPDNAWVQHQQMAAIKVQSIFRMGRSIKERIKFSLLKDQPNIDNLAFYVKLQEEKICRLDRNPAVDSASGRKPDDRLLRSRKEVAAAFQAYLETGRTKDDAIVALLASNLLKTIQEAISTDPRLDKLLKHCLGEQEFSHFMSRILPAVESHQKLFEVVADCEKIIGAPRLGASIGGNKHQLDRMAIAKQLLSSLDQPDEAALHAGLNDIDDAIGIIAGDPKLSDVVISVFGLEIDVDADQPTVKALQEWKSSLVSGGADYTP